MDPAQGFAAQAGGGERNPRIVSLGFPLSSTHTIAGAVIGAGAVKRLSAVRCGVAGNMLVAWVLTLPAAGCTAGLVYAFARLFGTGAVGPSIVCALAIGVLSYALIRRRWLDAPSPLPA